MMNKRKILTVLIMILSLLLTSFPAVAAQISITNKVEIKDKDYIVMLGYNSCVVKQSQGTIIWLANAEDVEDEDVIAAIRQADPSIKETYVVVTGEGTFRFRDYFSGNAYKNTEIIVENGEFQIKGPYSHASPFFYSKNDEPEVTEPEVTEPEITEPEITEPEVTEPEVTEPEVTEPEITEPEVTEPEVTEPEVTEPEVTEPEVTEPEVTEPEVTEPEVTEPEVTEPEVTEPEVTEPEVTDPTDPVPQNGDDPLVEILDEDVPLANIPKTGDPMVLYGALTALSGIGLAVLGIKKKEE